MYKISYIRESGPHSWRGANRGNWGTEGRSVGRNNGCGLDGKQKKQTQNRYENKTSERLWRNAAIIASQALDDAMCKVIGWGHRVPPAGLPNEQVFGEYSLSLPS